MTYSYRAYGLSWLSRTPVPGLLAEPDPSDPPDIVLEIGCEPQEWVLRSRSLPSSVRHSRPTSAEVLSPAFSLTVRGVEEFFELEYCDGARFVTDGSGKHVWGTCQAPLTMEDLAVYLRGPIMGFVLRRRGITSLHASAVHIHGRAIVLCGATETGKSTTAAALALRGTPVLCDDITALREHNRGFQVEPGYPRVCLWPDVVEDLLGAADTLPRLTPGWEKCFLPLDGSNTKFERQRRPLGAVYLLASRAREADAPRIEEVSAREALLGLVQNTYMNWVLDQGQRAAEFDMLTKVVTQVPVRRIVPHADPERVGALCDLIIADVERLASPRDPAALVLGR